jgi:hypothetical protein
MKGGDMVRNPVFCKLTRISEVTELRRNYQCTEYDACLMDAAMRDLDLDCDCCPLKDAKHETQIITEMEIFGCIKMIKTAYT